MASVVAEMLGSLFSAFGQSEYKGMFMSLDAAGKTTILYKMKLGEVITTIPTIGFNVESFLLPRSSISLITWDVGGCDKIRPLWKHYFPGTHVIIYVVDSKDLDRLGKCN